MAQHEIAFALVFVLLLPTVQLSPVENTIKGFFKKGGNHTNNWAVLVSTSRFWFNYRHSANVLSIYRVIKRYRHYFLNFIYFDDEFEGL
jgi:glycosylphosphatidylinositol transamidase (GPIT) subunit GPI8